MAADGFGALPRDLRTGAAAGTSDAQDRGERDRWDTSIRAREVGTGGGNPGAGGDDADLPPYTMPEVEARLRELAAMHPLQRKAAMKAAKGRFPGVPTLAELGKAVAAEERRMRAEAARAVRAAPPPPPGTCRWPEGFRMDRAGLWREEENGETWIAQPFAVVGEARDAASAGWGLLLRWEDGDGVEHRAIVRAADAHGPPGTLEAGLADAGLRVTADPGARARLRDALTGLRHGSRIRTVPRPGWHGTGAGASYMHPDGTPYPAKAEEPLHLIGETRAGATASAGTAEGWREEAAALAVGNPLAAFALSAAFAGPLLAVLGEEGGGFHLYGRSKAGKTAALRLAASAWGPPSPDGSLGTWRATGNGLEAALAEAADGLVTLDELGEADPRGVAPALYLFANGTAKARMTKTLAARARATWRTVVLSSGEEAVAAVAASAGKPLPPGAATRVPDVPVDGEAWPARHGHPTREAFMGALHRAVGRHHGHAARAFIAALAEERRDDPGGLAGAVETMRAAVLRDLPADADPQMRHAARAFGIVAAAGELAGRWGITGWREGTATEAARAMMGAWSARRGSGAGEERDAVERLRAFLSRHGASRFAVIRDGRRAEAQDDRAGERGRVAEARGEEAGGGPLGLPAEEERTINRAGWRRKEPDGWRYHVTPSAWGEMHAGADPVAAARILADRGLLQRAEGGRLTGKVAIPGEGRPRLYTIPPGALDGEEA